LELGFSNESIRMSGRLAVSFRLVQVFLPIGSCKMDMLGVRQGSSWLQPRDEEAPGIAARFGE